jgi:hypothetical protein
MIFSTRSINLVLNLHSFTIFYIIFIYGDSLLYIMVRAKRNRDDNAVTIFTILIFRKTIIYNNTKKYDRKV